LNNPKSLEKTTVSAFFGAVKESATTKYLKTTDQKPIYFFLKLLSVILQQILYFGYFEPISLIQQL